MLLARTEKKISSVACGFSLNNIHFSDYSKSLISINNSDILFKKTKTLFITVCFGAITVLVLC